MAGAFWRIGFAQPSSIDSILDKDDFTLQDLLDDDDILQECRQANKKLTEYLAEPDVIRTLLEYVVNEPSDDLNERQRFKYPNIASEVLTSECWPIMDAICQPDALELLWSTLDRPQPLNPLLASFFTKVIIMLLNKEVEMITKYLMDRPEITDKLISHLATPAIMDVILKMTTVETAGEAEEETSLNKFWADDTKLVGILIGLFNTDKSGASDAVIGNAGLLIEDLVTSGRKEAIEMQEFSTPSPFLLQLTSEEKLKELLGFMFDAGNSPAAMKVGLDVLNVMLSEPERGEDEAPPTDMDNVRHQQEISRILIALEPFVVSIHGLLMIEPPALMTANGLLAPPLGSARLNAARTVEALVTAKNAAIDQKLIELKTIPKLFEFFITYAENSFISAYVHNIVRHVCSNPPGTDVAALHAHLYQDCELLQKLMTLYRLGVAPEVDPCKSRLGYTGYVIMMANVVNSSKGTPGDPVTAYFGEAFGAANKDIGVQWTSFVGDELADANSKASSTFAERPSMHSFDSDDDDDDDIYGGGEVAHHAQLQFSRYLNERIAVDIPDDYAVDDDDDDEAEENLADDYGRLGTFSDKIDYSTDPLPQATVDNWQIVDAAGNPLGQTSNTTVIIKAPEDEDNRPGPLDLGGGDAAIATRLPSDPVAVSTPLDAAAGWVDFGDAAPKAPDTGDWAAFGDTPAAPTPADSGQLLRQDTPLIGEGEGESETLQMATPTEAEVTEDEEPDEDEPLPELPSDDSPTKAGITLEGPDGGESGNASTDPTAEVAQDIEGGGNLFSSAV